MHSLRQEEIRKKQATPDCEYYPWGRPGGGAPIKAEDPGNIRAELRRSVIYYVINSLRNFLAMLKGKNELINYKVLFFFR